MGFNVGMPMLKLKRGVASGKHAGNLQKILMEAGEERASATKTFDPSKSDLNIHLGEYSKGWDACMAIEDEVKEYEEEYKRTSYRGRGLRSDAAIAFAFIIKPESEWINAQTPEEQERFFSDSYEALKELGIIKEDDIRMRVRHMDEGAPHEHIISMAYDKNGKLAGSRLVNLKTFALLNRDYPKKMQELGWDVNELKAYDPEAVKNMTDEEKKAYKEDSIKKKLEKQHGLSANAYIAMKETEKANELRHEIEAEIADLEPKRRQVKQELDKAEVRKTEIEKATYNAGFKAHTLARDIEQAMKQPKSHKLLNEVVEDAETYFKQIDIRAKELYEREHNLNTREKSFVKEQSEIIRHIELAQKAISSSKKTATIEEWSLGFIKQLPGIIPNPKLRDVLKSCVQKYVSYVNRDVGKAISIAKEALSRRNKSKDELSSRIFYKAEEIEEKEKERVLHRNKEEMSR